MRIEIKYLDEVFTYLDDIDEKRAKEEVQKATQIVWQNVRFFAKPHHKTGTLERNIRHKAKTYAGIVWIADSNMLVDWRGKTNYAVFVVKGTRPHPIHPKRKKALRFYNSLDEFVFAKAVYHPGYKGDDFLKKAIQKTLQDLERS